MGQGPISRNCARAAGVPEGVKYEARVLVGFLVAGLGAAGALLAWAPLARSSVEGGFEGLERDLSVLYLHLPLVALGGALVPLGVWLVALARFRRPWLALLAAGGAGVLGVWGLVSWWTPPSGA